MRPSLEEFWGDVSTYVDVALDLDRRARDRWLDELHACCPALAGTLRAHLVELGALAGQDLFESAHAVALVPAPGPRGAPPGAAGGSEISRPDAHGCESGAALIAK